jgi:ArsR family transcriptional regulator, virulence genes transcriptional regulator
MSDESLPAPTDRDLERIVAALRGMAYEPRFRILMLLSTRPESTPVDLTDALPLDGTIVAHHLRHLLEARLIRRRRRGRRVFYALTDEATRRLVGDVLRYAGVEAVPSVPEAPTAERREIHG